MSSWADFFRTIIPHNSLYCGIFWVMRGIESQHWAHTFCERRIRSELHTMQSGG
jgi:hypothetical protein